MRLILLTLLAALLTPVAGPTAGPAAAAQAPQDCFWTSVFDEENSNLFYPDTGVNYYLGRVALPPGGRLVVRGQYPHSRYTSFNVYDETFKPTDALADVDIRPDRGSVNPFVVGNRRDRARRDYTVKVVPAPAPARDRNRARNTVYLGDEGRSRYNASMVLRVYLPDRGRNQYGGVPLPEVALRLPDGTELDQPATCTALTQQPSTGVTEADQQGNGPSLPDYTTARKHPDWERFFNVPRTMLRQFSQTLADEYGAESRGGFFSDGNNAYVYAFMARDLGRVLVLRGRMPDVPETYRRERVFTRGQLRYWSMCSVSMQPYGVTDTIGCVNDARTATSREGWYTVVVSTPEDRPANARRECGVTWLPFGIRPTAALVMRNQLANPRFPHAIQKVRRPGTEREVMGAFLPRGHYTGTRAFQRRGC
ncbi:hypothetical protein [Nocardioides sp.]|uniref:hypothetical protein n=1 Tax=Nocardioides sp. TaxID=35761 RepID=UPI002D80C8C5|nr:hypothetical protein [Nocardioides sp.]HET8959134.1 hypothetical protein [Nocardioides sp.]